MYCMIWSYYGELMIWWFCLVVKISQRPLWLDHAGVFGHNQFGIQVFYTSHSLMLHGIRMCCLWKNTGNLKNHWTKHRLVCTHLDAFFMLIPNMGIIFYNFDIFGKKWQNLKNEALNYHSEQAWGELMLRYAEVNALVIILFQWKE